MIRFKNPISWLMSLLFILLAIAILFILKDLKQGGYTYLKNARNFDVSSIDANNNLLSGLSKPGPGGIIHFTNFGDIMFDRLVKKDLQADKNPFANLAGSGWNFLRQTDFNIANLEGPISSTSHCQQKSINFEFEPSVASLISLAGFKLLNLANNHSYDCYIEGAQDTAKYLSAAGIDYFGGEYIDRPYTIKEINGKKIAFVGFYALLPSADIVSMTKMVKQLKSKNDFVVIDVHWGEEYHLHSNTHQQQIAHQWIDAGADIIIGHHPHVIEEMEIYRAKPIFYSLGNFIFDQNFGETTKGLGVEVSLGAQTDRSIAELVAVPAPSYIILHPFNIFSRQPTLFSADENQQFCDRYLIRLTQIKTCEIQY